jgi:hypothetical protein
MRPAASTSRAGTTKDAYDFGIFQRAAQEAGALAHLLFAPAIAT